MENLGTLYTDKPLKKYILPPPASQKYVQYDIPVVENKLNNTALARHLGTNYVNKYVEKEEKDLLQSTDYDQNAYGKDHKLDEISEGTTPMLSDVNTEMQTKIYKIYNFAYRPKPNLTITSMKDHIISMIETNPIVVIQGPTGCGKTTQLPQFILDSCYKKKQHCNIIVTQPRRIAAISIAKRVSQEREWPLGTLVGFQVGMINNTSQDTRLTYCTTGVLLQKLINSKHMLDYTHIVLDEIHERDQDMDFLILVVRKLFRTNSRTVKIILMSATFNVERFAKYFSSPLGNKLIPAPIIDIAKKNYFNVNIYYLCQIGMLGPLPEVSETEPKVTKNMINFCINIVIVMDELDRKGDDEIYDKETGLYNRHVILIFLPGIHEIEEMHESLSLPKFKNSKWDIVVLHSSITNQEQQRIFEQPPKGYRRIILSTNIAESSITVPDVKYVIDFCLTKQLVTDVKSNFQCLELTWASKANCDQRAGRTGRVMDGRVYRLVPEHFYENILPSETIPELLRAPLENVVLKAKMLDMGKPKAILALSLDPPDLSNLQRTVLILKEAGALLNRDDQIEPFDGDITDLGRVMASLPLNIHITKLIVLGHLFSVLKDTIIIGCSMAVKDMFSTPFQKKLLAYNVKLAWSGDSESDCIAFLNVFEVWANERANRRLNNNDVEKNWAYRNFVQIKILREIQALVQDVTTRLDKFGIRESVGINKVVWNKSEKSFILKIVIAGAFYPNYFVKRSYIENQSERDEIKLLGGFDPTKTIYLQGWPLKQPGVLYTRTIQKIFQNSFSPTCSKIKVSFDGSSRVYIQFGKKEGGIHKDTDRKICLSVYKAIKMRQCKIPIEVPLLSEDVAAKRAKELNISDKLPHFYSNKNISTENKLSYSKPQFPGFDISYIPIIVINFIDPGHFWIHIKDDETLNHIRYIEAQLNSQNLLQEFSSVPKVGTLVAVPFQRRNHVQFYRGIVESYAMNSNDTLIRCQLIDIGCVTEVQLCNIKKINNYKNIAAIPALAFECVLANIRPIITANDNGRWSSKAHEIIHQLFNRNVKIFGEIYSIVNSVITLNLICVKENGEKIYVNQYLIDENLAMWKEEDYHSRYNHSLRQKHIDMSTNQRHYYEGMQYDQCDLTNNYPEPPSQLDCISSVYLRGPFSPLEIDLAHLTIAGIGKRVLIEMNSVNSVLLECSSEGSSEHFLVAGSVNQNAAGNNLMLRNTTLLPAIPGLKSLLALIFTPHMELRRNEYNTYYIGALCGLGCDSASKTIFVDHDMEINFDVEISIDDLQDINRLRHWMNIGMHFKHNNVENVDNSEEIIICQNRIKSILSKIMNKNRKKRSFEMMDNFNKWNLYEESLFLKPGNVPMIKNNIYNLHYALELEERSENFEEMTAHIKELHSLVIAEQKPKDQIYCKLCQVFVPNVPTLRGHLYSLEHKENEKKININK